MNFWKIKIRCIEPICDREFGPILAANKEQAILVATQKAIDLFGQKNQGWDELDVYITNATYANAKI